jgi:hypothetical protein
VQGEKISWDLSHELELSTEQNDPLIGWGVAVDKDGCSD